MLGLKLGLRGRRVKVWVRVYPLLSVAFICASVASFRAKITIPMHTVSEDRRVLDKVRHGSLVTIHVTCQDKE